MDFNWIRMDSLTTQSKMHTLESKANIWNFGMFPLFSYITGKSWKPIRWINLMNLSWQIGFFEHKNSWRNYNSQNTHPIISIQFNMHWYMRFLMKCHSRTNKKEWKLTNPTFILFLWDHMNCARFSTLAWSHSSSNEIDSTGTFVSDIASYSMKDSIYGFLSNISLYSYFVAISFPAIYSNRMKSILVLRQRKSIFVKDVQVLFPYQGKMLVFLLYFFVDSTPKASFIKSIYDM